MNDSVSQERRSFYMRHEGIPLRVELVDFGDLGPTKAFVHAGNRLLYSAYPFHSIGTAKELVEQTVDELLQEQPIDWTSLADEDPDLVSETGFVIHAASFAARKHSTQRRKDADASPYINHPLRVAELVSEVGGVHDATVLAAALLHDTIEDTETTSDEIRKEFGPVVAGIVLEVTDDKALPKAERKRLQVDHASKKSRAARLVKLADKIANLRDILDSPPDDWDSERRLAYFRWARDVVQGLRGTNPQLEAAFDCIYAEGVAVIERQ